MSRRKPPTRADFLGRVERWTHKLRVQPRSIRMQPMTRKWGSCSTKGTLSFSTDLLREEIPFQDYVIVHELLHLRVANHGKLFRSLLATYIPDWRKWSSTRNGEAERGI